ncbi:60S ribosomal protein L24-like [Mesocricetus auratus]|uniref:60S ribosomal protein L24-like n=1 Tax=Mesocricetus auratus TaxID=10036 RepID=A0ABM2XL42_MESAU|nr:60S ribosomal protein L24-like [Mesocricetus auratus]
MEVLSLCPMRCLPFFLYTISTSTALAMTMEWYSFSRYKIYPRRGYHCARTDGKESLTDKLDCPPQKHAQKRNRQTKFKRPCHAVKFQWAVPGASPVDIMAERNKEPEVRKARLGEQAVGRQGSLKGKAASRKTAMAAAQALVKAIPKEKPARVATPRVSEHSPVLRRRKWPWTWIQSAWLRVSSY